MTALTRERFDEITEGFERTVLHNNGLYRHIQYRHPDLFDVYWEVITWPGGATIRGDYGTAFTIERIEDMLQFFNRGVFGSDVPEFDYWEEKVTSGREQCKRFSEEKLRKRLLETIRGYEDCTCEASKKIADEFTSMVTEYGESGLILLNENKIYPAWLDVDTEEECTCGAVKYVKEDIDLALSDIDPGWWESVDGMEWSYDWQYACYALMRTARDWWANLPATTPRIQIRQFGNNNTQIGAVGTLTIGGERK